MKKTNLLVHLALLVFASQAMSKTVLLKSEQIRNQYLKNGEVWSAPAWISSDFKFSPELNMQAGPPLKDKEYLLKNNDLHCLMTPETAEAGASGKTSKFFCKMLEQKSDGSYEQVKGAGKIKVKYGSDNGEIYGELLSTRLLWALGFSADRMYYMENTYCFGCTENPFKNNKVDASTLTNPRLFSRTAIERKLEGDEVFIKRKIVTPPSPGEKPPRPSVRIVDVVGWDFKEIMDVVSDDPIKARQQKIEREALSLLANMIQHTDNKSANQRILCDGKVNDLGLCEGRVKLLIQDTGATFGKGFSLSEFNLAKVDVKHWKSKSIWSKPEKCKTNMGYWFTQATKSLEITEEGRQFLLQLLNGFTEGEAGRKRVADLFVAARVNNRDGSIEEWTDLFMDKVNQIRYPMGASQPNFQCPKHIN